MIDKQTFTKEHFDILKTHRNVTTPILETEILRVFNKKHCKSFLFLTKKYISFRSILTFNTAHRLKFIKQLLSICNTPKISENP